METPRERTKRMGVVSSSTSTSGGAQKTPTPTFTTAPTTSTSIDPLELIRGERGN